VTDRENLETGPVPKRMPGKYIVYAMVGFGSIFLVFMIILALRLSPAAERFHTQPQTNSPR